MIRRSITSLAVLLVLLGAFTLNGCTLLRGGSETPPVFGTWQFTMSSPSQGTMTGRMTIAQGDEDGTYTGDVTVPDAGITDAVMNVQSLTLDGPSFVLTASAAGNQFTITGVVNGDTMTGENNVSGVGVWVMEATRVME